MALGIYRMCAIYYKICIDSYEIYLLECFTSPLRGDQIEVFTILNGYENIDSNIFLKLRKVK